MDRAAENRAAETREAAAILQSAFRTCQARREFRCRAMARDCGGALKAELRATREQWCTVEAELAELRAAKEQQGAALHAVRAQLGLAEAELVELRAAKEKLGVAEAELAELRAAKEKMGGAEAELAELRAAKEQLGGAEAELAELRAAKKQLSDRLSTLRTELKLTKRPVSQRPHESWVLPDLAEDGGGEAEVIISRSASPGSDTAEWLLPKD